MPTLLTPPAPFLATRRQVLGGAAALIALGACGTDDAPPTGRTRTVQGDFGPVEVPIEPNRVAASTSSDVDVALVLGLPLVAAPGLRGSGRRPFPSYEPADRLAGVEKFGVYPELEIEKVASARPDCILNGGQTIPDFHERLSAVAPTLSYSTQLYDDWRAGLRHVAGAFSLEDAAQRAVDDYDRRLEAIRPAVAQRWGGARLAMIYPVGTSGQFTVYARGAQTLRSAADAGFALADITPADFDGHQEYSAEQLDVLESVDILLLFLDVSTDDGQAEGDQRDRAGYRPLQDSPLWSRLPAVRAGAVHEVPSELAYASPLTAPANLDLLERTLLA